MEDTGDFSGRHVIAVIGIDRYLGWRRLSNAVRDARGVAALFEQLGFEQVSEPLLDERATGKAIQGLVTDDLRTLGPGDSLVLFYAGHGGSRMHRFGSQMVKTGYLIPVDATDKGATWVELDAWLRAVSLLPAKHILVILDACHSGIALGPIIKWRNDDMRQDTSLSTLKSRRSRRIITSALDDQVVLDTGPVYGHSLFTGCLIEGLTQGLGHSGRRVATSSELGLYLQRRVETYPSSRQTPDFGAFDFDDRGEMVIPVMIKGSDEIFRPGDQVLHATTDAELTTAAKPDLAKAWGAPPATNSASSSALVAVSEPAMSREHPRKRMALRYWVVVSGTALVLPLALFAYNMFGEETHPGGPLPDAPAQGPPGAPVVAAESQTAGLSLTSCPEGMVPVPAGTFQMGSPEGRGDTDEHPQYEVKLSGYCIDKTEVTVAAFGDCVAAKACRVASVSWSGYSVEEVRLYEQWCNRKDRSDHPMNCIDWNQAAAYCKWKGKRLPTEAEWEYAARGKDGRTYPWGQEAPSARRLNACGSECVAMIKRELGEPKRPMHDGNDGWETTAPVGIYPDGASPFGVLDMAGNVWEWTADWYGAYSEPAQMNPQGPEVGTSRVIRGGGWRDDDVIWNRAADRFRFVPSFRFFDIGFRCARGESTDARS